MKLLNLIFPKKCISCGEFTDNKMNDPFCPICRTKYETMKRERCRACGKMHIECRCVSQKLKNIGIPLTQRHIFAFGSDLSRTLIYKLKRKNLRLLQKFLACECASVVKEETESKFHEEFVIVYPPRSKSAIKEYGFDHAHIIASEVSKITDIPLLNIFVRNFGGKAQKTLSASEREVNANKSFGILEDYALSGLSFIIIDDVVTSGSTAARLSELLKLQGAKRLIVVSVSKV